MRWAICVGIMEVAAGDLYISARVYRYVHEVACVTDDAFQPAFCSYGHLYIVSLADAGIEPFDSQALQAAAYTRAEYTDLSTVCSSEVFA